MTTTITQPAGASTSTWHIDPAHTQAEFEVKHMMFATVRGRFAAVAGSLHLSPTDVTRSRVEAVIETATVDTGQAQRDGHLRSADFFDVAQFPTLTFVSRQIRTEEDGDLVVTGDLTIRGVTREVALAVQETGRGVDPWGKQRIGFSASTTIDRRDFGLTWNQALESGGILVGTSVRIRLEIQAVESAA